MRTKFKIIESLVLNKPAIKSPEARGPFTIQRTYSIPTNSTIAGAIASSLYIDNKININKNLDWSNISNIDDFFRNEVGIDLYGPYIEKDGKIYVNFFDNIVEKDKLIVEIKKYLKDDLLPECKSTISKIIENVSKNSIQRKVSKIGIALESNKKIIKEGYLYSQELLMLDDAYIVLECLNECKKLINNLNNKVVRLGGKGKVTKIEIDDESKLIKEIKNNKSDKAILISDAILEIDIEKDDDIQKIMEKIRKKYKFDVLCGELEYGSIGWDISIEHLKPYYLFLKAGSIIKISEEIKDYKVGELRSIGYGSFLPIPL